MPVRTDKRNLVLVLTLASPPVNAISASSGLIAELAARLTEAQADDTVHAVVICGDGRMFSAGADLADFGDDPARDVAPIRALVEQIEALEKPVVIALHGAALGGGLEVALAGHYRIATSDSKLGLPEVTLGLLPGAGGTQRVTRLVGVKAALDLILSGRTIGAQEALSLGLIDAIAAGDRICAAVEAAQRLSESGTVRRSSAVSVVEDRAAVTAAREAEAGRPRRSEARDRIIDAVEAATLPFAEGLKVEAALFDRLMLSEPSRGLRHAFLGERIVGRVQGAENGAAALPVTSVAVIGSGTMGAGIAAALLASGLPVTLIDQRQAAVDRASSHIDKIFDDQVSKGRLAAAAAAQRKAALSTGTDLAAAGDADMVIEAVFEDIDVKRQVLEALDRLAKPSAILATNTSTLDVNQLAAFTARPERVVGTHFFSPANIMKLLEIVRGEQTAPAVVASTMEFARRIGKVGVVAGVCDGFIGNRLFEEYLRQAYFLLEEGALPNQIDDALERWGMAMGPLRVMDLAGQDIGWSIRKRRAIEQPNRPYSRIPDLVCELGRFGQKAGAGYYRYPEGARRGTPDPDIEAMIVAHSTAIGVTRREITEAEIVERCIYALINEGAKAVAEGIARRPVDVDIVYLHGYGFPATRGGPMFYADRVGLAKVLDQVRSFSAGRHGWAFEPATLLVDMAGRGLGFASLNR